jgi:hypothetical protein
MSTTFRMRCRIRAFALAPSWVWNADVCHSFHDWETSTYNGQIALKCYEIPGKR